MDIKTQDKETWVKGGIIMGVLGKIGDTIQDVSKNITKTTIKDTAGLMLQSREELDKAAREVAKNKINASSFIKRSDVENLINSSPFAVNKNADYISATSKLLKSAETKDMDQFREVANALSSNPDFNDRSYLDLLLKAENDANNTKGYIDSMEGLVAFQNSVSLPKIADSFFGKEGQDKIKEGLYHLNGKKAYFKSGDPKTNRVRAAGTATGYMGAMTVARLAHGGSLTQNEYGQRDIVGIPFV
jgi:hypothetical protein